MDILSHNSSFVYIMQQTKHLRFWMTIQDIIDSSYTLKVLYYDYISVSNHGCCIVRMGYNTHSGPERAAISS